MWGPAVAPQMPQQDLPLHLHGAPAPIMQEPHQAPMPWHQQPGEDMQPPLPPAESDLPPPPPDMLSGAGTIPHCSHLMAL